MRSQIRSPAERFYTESHRRSLLAHPDSSPSTIPAQDGIATIARPSHRYHCVYDHLVARPGQIVVELGFGQPSLLSAIASLCARLTIVDLVDRTSETNLPPNVSLTIADLNDPFPFADQQFDSVIAMMVVEHLFDPFVAFRELARVLRIGGYAFVNLPNIASIRCRLSLLVGKMPVTSSRDWFQKREWDGNHLHYFTVADTRRLAGLFGLQLLEIHAVGRLRQIKKLRPTLFCHEISYVFCRQSGAE